MPINLGLWQPPTSIRTLALNQHRPASWGSIILDKPTTITVDRFGTALAAQVVRLDMLSAPDAEEYGDAWAVNATQPLLLSGYKNHPTVTDTNLQMGDRFLADGQNYVVLKVETQFSDRLLAVVEATNGA